MKSLIILFAGVFVSGLLMTSCGNTKECPAYGQVESNVEVVNLA